MSILEEYEEIRREIGDKKMDAIDEYLKEMGNEEKIERELEKIEDIKFSDKWFEEKEKLRKKYKPAFYDDVLYHQEEWEKFDKWYEEKKKTKQKEKRNKEAR